MTIKELQAICNAFVEAGLGDREIMFSDYHLGNTHRQAVGTLTPLEKVSTSVPVRRRKKYVVFE